jgi:rubrerythrin
MTDLTTHSSIAGSGWERDLWTHLISHVDAERGMLEEYSAIAKQSQSKAFGYLVKLLIEDETRHHRMFMELAKSLKTAAELTGDDPIVPTMDFTQVNRIAVLEATKQLIEKEEQDARELKRLQRELRDVKDTTLWSLLVNMMQRDTQKHIAILRFVSKHARRRSVL